MRIAYSLLVFFFLGSFLAQAQYTTTINSNRPGNSQGAFAVGTEVLQLETGLSFGQDSHELLNQDADLYGLDFSLRYGLIWEELEISWMGNFLYQSTTIPMGASESVYTVSNFERNTIGAKYLVYDPYKHEDASQINIRSWKANRKFRFSKLIPAVSVYAGANLMFGDNPYMFEDEGSISPRVAVITQNNWGPWVLVMNLIGDKVTEEFPTYAGIFTLTHSINGRFAIFGEYQVIKSDIYSDNIARGGAAYLFSKNFQVDLSGLVNFKDTPQRWQVAAGVSYRLDMHSNDVFVEDRNNRRDTGAKNQGQGQQQQQGQGQPPVQPQ